MSNLFWLTNRRPTWIVRRRDIVELKPIHEIIPGRNIELTTPGLDALQTGPLEQQGIDCH